MNKIRLDKFLWMTRLYKTRNFAMEACKKNKVCINEMKSKPSKLVMIDDIIRIQKNYIEYQYKIISLPNSRTNAKDVKKYINDLTLQTELDKLTTRKQNYSIQFQRKPGSGRPTKKDRRIIDKFLDNQ